MSLSLERTKGRMPRAVSTWSDMSEGDNDVAEQELVKLQQQFRIMEGERKSYSEESQNTLRKQKVAIEALQEENGELTKETSLAGSSQNQSKDTNNVGTLSDMLRVEDELSKQLQNEKKKITNLDTEIQDNERKISRQRKNAGGGLQSQTKQTSWQKQLRILENRVDQASKKFNQSLADNGKLRGDIDHLRTERTIFEGLYQKLERKLDEIKKESALVVEASTQAYDARDDAQSKMLALKEKSDKELTQYVTELKELQRIIDHDRKLKEFMAVKSDERADTLDSASLLLRKAEKDKLQEKETTIQTYESAFNRIKASTSIDDIDLLVEIFIQVEDKNFALFNYVNELNNEIELLQENIEKVKREIYEFEHQTVHLDDDRQAVIRQYQDEEETVHVESKQHEKRCKQIERMLSQLRVGIDSLFSKTDCDAAVIRDMLGGQAGITNGNIMQHLGIIEQRTNELLHVLAFVAEKDEEREEALEAIGLLGKGPLDNPQSSYVIPPSTGDDYPSDYSQDGDDDAKPLSQDELKQKIMRGLSRQDAAKMQRSRSHQSMTDRSEGKSSSRKSTRHTTKKRTSLLPS